MDRVEARGEYRCHLTDGHRERAVAQALFQQVGELGHTRQQLGQHTGVVPQVGQNGRAHLFQVLELAGHARRVAQRVQHVQRAGAHLGEQRRHQQLRQPHRTAVELQHVPGRVHQHRGLRVAGLQQLGQGAARRRQHRVLQLAAAVGGGKAGLL